MKRLDVRFTRSPGDSLPVGTLAEDRGRVYFEYWTLTPAYDLLFTPGPGGEHTMTLVGEGRDPGRSHMLRLAKQADVSRREADAIIAEVQAAVARWLDHAANAGLSKAAAQQITESLPKLA